MPTPSVPSNPFSTATSAPASDPSLLQNATTCYNSVAQSPPNIPEIPEAPRPNPDLNSCQLLAANTKPLTAQQLSAIDLLITGHSDSKTAAALNLHRVTITRWRLYNHVFQAEFNRRRQEVFGCAADKLRASLSKAVNVFRKQLLSQDDFVSFRAARALIQLAGSNSILRPPDPAIAPTEPTAVLDIEARKFHIQIASTDPKTDGLDEDDRALALRSLMYRNHINPLPEVDFPAPNGNTPIQTTTNPQPPTPNPQPLKPKT